MTKYTKGPYEIKGPKTKENPNLGLWWLEGSDGHICGDLNKFDAERIKLCLESHEIFLAACKRSLDYIYNPFEPDNQSKIYYDIKKILQSLEGSDK